MIPNQWYAILESNQVKRGKISAVKRMGQNLIAWRDSQDIVTVMNDLCPHRGAALSKGKITGDRIQCPFHGFEYDPSGSCKMIPAQGNRSKPPKALHVANYPTREANDLIYIWWGEARPEYPPLPFFENITDDFVYHTIRDQWSIHYSRAIENQLDVMHLPFVHHNTIGRGNRTLVHGPFANEESLWPGDQLINLWVHNEADEGQKSLKPSEISKPDERPLIQFRFPNLWQNWLSDDFLVFLVFAPVDDESTMMYLRTYHKLHLPVLRSLTNWLAHLGNSYILRQDKRVVITQRPKRADLGTGEILVAGDHPIVLYRKRRKALIAEAKPTSV